MVTGATHFYSSNLVCGSCSGPVMGRPHVPLPAWGGLLSACVDRKLELIVRACILLLGLPAATCDFAQVVSVP